jgi:hypothetical protein
VTILSLAPVAIDLNCQFPAQYPSESPSIDIEIKKGLAAKRKEEILAIIAQVGQENIGAPAIYTIVEAVREWLADNNVAGQVYLNLPHFCLSISLCLSAGLQDGSMYSDMMRRMQQKDVDKKKTDDKAAIARAADAEVFHPLFPHF